MNILTPHQKAEAVADALKLLAGSKAILPTTRTPTNKRQRNPPLASEGIFYVLRLPKGWQIFPYRFQEYPELGHVDLWDELLAGKVARGWFPTNEAKAQEFTARLKMYTYAFPRGRIIKLVTNYRILHGPDLHMIRRKEIERIFAITGHAKWQRDEHEQVQWDDKENVRSMLNLEENWPSVDPDYGF